MCIAPFDLAFAQGPLHTENGERWDGESNITVLEGHYVEAKISFTANDGLLCQFNIYFEIRDGSQQTGRGSLVNFVLFTNMKNT